MTSHQLAQFQRVHQCVKDLYAKFEALKQQGVNLKAEWLSGISAHFEEYAALYLIAEAQGAKDSDLFEFDFANLDNVLGLTDTVNQDWSNNARVESSLRTLRQKAFKKESAYIKFVYLKNQAAEIWGDGVTLRNDAIAKSAAIEELSASARKIYEDLRSLAANIRSERTASSQGDHFEQLAYSYGSESRNWLYALIAVSTLAIAFGLWEIFGKHDVSLGSSELYHWVAGRVAVFAIVLYLIRFMSQSYAQAQHNRIVNLHRSRALRSLERVIAAVEGQDARSVIIAKAADALFSHQASSAITAPGGSKDSTDVRISLSADKGVPGSIHA